MTFLHRKLKLIALSFVIAVGWLVWISGLVGNNGLVQARKLEIVKTELELRVQALEKEKKRLENNLDLLETDSVTQERVVRDTLGYVRENELVLEFD